MKNNNFEKIGFPGADNHRDIDLRSYALKQYDYISSLAEVAKSENERYVQSAKEAIRRFPRNIPLIQQQVFIVENRLRERINQIQRTKQSTNPGPSIFKEGILAGFLANNPKQAVTLSLDELNKNTFISGKTGEGKTNIIFNWVPQFIKRKIFTIMFDFKLKPEYRNLLQLPECRHIAVFTIRLKDKDNMFDPDGEIPEEWFLFIWDSLQQSYEIKEPTQIMLLNYCRQLFKARGVFCLDDLQNHLERELSNPEIRQSEKNKIHTCLKTLSVIRLDAGEMVQCKRGYSLKEIMKEFDAVSYEFKGISEHGRKWIMKLKLRRLHAALEQDADMNRLNVMIIADEGKVPFGKDLFHNRYLSYIKQLFTQGRGAYGVGWIVGDQNYVSEIADFVLQNIETNIFLRQGLPSENRNVSFILGCDPQEILNIHQPYAMMRKSNWPYAFKIWIPKSPISKRLSDDEVFKDMEQKLSKISYMPIENQIHKRAKLIVQKQDFDQSPSLKRVSIINKKNPLSDLEIFLQYIKNKPGCKVTDIYRALRLSGRKGNTIKANAKGNGLIIEKAIRREGKGRPALLLELTDQGKEYICEKLKA